MITFKGLWATQKGEDKGYRIFGERVVALTTLGPTHHELYVQPRFWFIGEGIKNLKQ